MKIGNAIVGSESCVLNAKLLELSASEKMMLKLALPNLICLGIGHLRTAVRVNTCSYMDIFLSVCRTLQNLK